MRGEESFKVVLPDAPVLAELIGREPTRLDSTVDGHCADAEHRSDFFGEVELLLHI